jgi:hypothetical protein
VNPTFPKNKTCESYFPQKKKNLLCLSYFCHLIFVGHVLEAIAILFYFRSSTQCEKKGFFFIKHTVNQISRRINETNKLNMLILRVNGDTAKLTNEDVQSFYTTKEYYLGMFN